MNRNKVIPNYLGSKNVNGVYQFIINHIPPHETYIEGFLGSGIILQLKKPAKKSFAIDADAAVIDKFNCADLGNANIICGNALSEILNIIEIFSLAPIDTFIYLDPPYLPETRSSNSKYKFEMTMRDHVQLLALAETLSEKGFNIMISCYDNKLYQQNLIAPNWNKADVKSITRGGVRIETIYYNYVISKVHDTAFTGNNFTDRQRIKRKIARNISKIEKLPLQEKQAFLEAIQKRFF